MADAPLPSSHRVPVRAAFAYAGGGALGTFLAGATREVVGRIWQHNRALLDGATDTDPRLLHPLWGHITIDAVAGASAGALCACQLVKGLFEPDYLDPARPIDMRGTATGDWIQGASFAQLVGAGNQGTVSGSVESAGWTVMSGARLYDLAARALKSGGAATARDPASPLDPSGVVAVGISLTDVLGYHDPAEFDVDRVLGHPDFGCSPPSDATTPGVDGRPVRDLGGRGHAEIRKLFVGASVEADAVARQFLLFTKRRGRARCVRWSASATERLAALATASAALPFAVGPLAMTDRAADIDVTYRRLYVDGGVMNNKPVAPALELARWHDLMRLVQHRQAPTGEISAENVERELVYERVCFFLDAFPDRIPQQWEGPHPDSIYSETGTWQLTLDALDTRHEQISQALRTPGAGARAFFDTLLSSLRAQDLRVMARTNDRIKARDLWIDRLCGRLPYADPEFRLDDLSRAAAYGAVVSRPAGCALSMADRMTVAARVYEADQISDLEGRRLVTMVPVFAPSNLRAVFAGEGMYALGGLLHPEARLHDAQVGASVARHVMTALRRPKHVPPPVRLPDAPNAAVPPDAGPLLDRLQVLAETAVGADGSPLLVGRAVSYALRFGPTRRRALKRLRLAVRGDP